jgi:hypothetical protein
VPGKRHKHIFAHPTSLLIDDTLKNVEQFIAAKGQAIHHISVEDTVRELKSMLSQSGFKKLVHG